MPQLPLNRDDLDALRGGRRELGCRYLGRRRKWINTGLSAKGTALEPARNELDELEANPL